MARATGWYELYDPVNGTGGRTWATKAAALTAAKRRARSGSWPVQIWRKEPPSAGVQSFTIATVYPPLGRVEWSPTYFRSKVAGER